MSLLLKGLAMAQIPLIKKRNCCYRTLERTPERWLFLKNAGFDVT